MMQPALYMPIGDIVGMEAAVTSSVAGQPPGCAAHVQACGIDVSTLPGTAMAAGAMDVQGPAVSPAPQMSPMSLDF